MKLVLFLFLIMIIIILIRLNRRELNVYENFFTYAKNFCLSAIIIFSYTLYIKKWPLHL